MRSKGFTLVELLAVIVILAIILAIAVPGMTGIIQSSRKSSFEINAKEIIDIITTKLFNNSDYDVASLNTSNMNNDLGVSNENYASLKVSIEDNKVDIDIVGDNIWDGLEAHGTRDNLTIGTVSEENNSVQSTPECCFTFDFSTGTITGYDSENSSCPSDVVIPSKINNVPVEHIGPGAFINPTKQMCDYAISEEESLEDEKDILYVHTEGDGYDYCYFKYDETDNLTSVIIPNTIKSIGYYAFTDNQLTSVDIPSSVTSIGDEAFGSNQLTSANIPDGITDISEGAFGGNQLTSITIPNSVTTIGGWAFGNNQLTSITIPNSVTSIGYTAFMYNQLTSVTIPNSVTTIGNSAFSYNQLTSIIIPNSVTAMEDGTFYHNQLASATIGDGLTTIGNGAFQSNQLTSLSIGSNVTTIGLCAFESNQLTSITIPNSVTTIRDEAFKSNQLTSITIPNSVTFIGYMAFDTNNILQGNAKIDNNIYNISVEDEDGFDNNGYDGHTTITPIFLR